MILSSLEKGNALLLQRSSGLRIRVCIRGRRSVAFLPLSRDHLDRLGIQDPTISAVSWIISFQPYFVFVAIKRWIAVKE